MPFKKVKGREKKQSEAIGKENGTPMRKKRLPKRKNICFLTQLNVVTGQRIWYDKPIENDKKFIDEATEQGSCSY